MADEKKTNVFVIIMIVVIIMLIVFLAFCAAYFFQASSLNFPSNSQTVFMAWLTISILIILSFLLIYAIVAAVRGGKKSKPEKKQVEQDLSATKKRKKEPITNVNSAEIPTSRSKDLSQVFLVNDTISREEAANQLLVKPSGALFS